MTVKQQFPKGSLVKFSEEISWAVIKRGIGTVVGYSRDGECVWVQWDGCKNRRVYHKDYLMLTKRESI
jgi:hypothetical protein